jgi:hypothetical protein
LGDFLFGCGCGGLGFLISVGGVFWGCFWCWGVFWGLLVVGCFGFVVGFGCGLWVVGVVFWCLSGLWGCLVFGLGFVGCLVGGWCGG